jgi:hypothetical protein
MADPEEAGQIKIPTIPHNSGEAQKGKMMLRGRVELPTFRFQV